MAMDEEENLAPKEAPDKPSAVRKVLDTVALISYPTGLFAGWKVTRASIRDEARKNLLHTHIIDDLEKDRKDRGEKLHEELLAGNKGHKDISKELKALEEDFYLKRNNRYADAGIKTTGDYWGHLRPSEKFNSVIQGATVTSIIIGSTILITQSKNLFKHVFGNPDDSSPSR
jgi:hypothetical protein